MSDKYDVIWPGYDPVIRCNKRAIGCEEMTSDANDLVDEVERLRAECAELKRHLGACGRLCAEMSVIWKAVSDGEIVTLDEALEYDARCSNIAQKWMPPPTPEELAAIDEAFLGGEAGA